MYRMHSVSWQVQWNRGQNESQSSQNICSCSNIIMMPSMLFIISYTRISRRPSQHKSGLFKQQIPLNIPKHSTKITCQCTNPFHHLVRATPKTTRKPFRGHGRFYRPRPPWPPQRSAARPRRRGLPQPPDAAPSRLGRRGCDAEGGAAAAAVEKQSVAMGCFSGLLGKMWIDYDRS